MTTIKTPIGARLARVLLAGAAAGSLTLGAAAAQAQTPYGATQQQSQPSSQQDAFGAILGALFGTNGSSLDTEWARGRRPLNTGRTQFETRVTADVRSGALSSNSAARLRTDYDALVQLESRYASDGRFTAQERSDLNTRYAALTQTLDSGGYGDDAGYGASVAEGRADFEARVTAAVNARRITRTEGTRLRTDYQALIQTEAGYQRDGLSTRERDDLEARLDALDARLGDGPSSGGGYGIAVDPRTRLTNIETAVAAGERSGAISRTEAADIRVEHGDLVRLEAAYSRTNPSSADSAYLIRRLGELEARARVTRR